MSRERLGWRMRRWKQGRAERLARMPFPHPGRHQVAAPLSSIPSYTLQPAPQHSQLLQISRIGACQTEQLLLTKLPLRLNTQDCVLVMLDTPQQDSIAQSSGRHLEQSFICLTSLTQSCRHYRQGNQHQRPQQELTQRQIWQSTLEKRMLVMPSIGTRCPSCRPGYVRCTLCRAR